MLTGLLAYSLKLVCIFELKIEPVCDKNSIILNSGGNLMDVASLNFRKLKSRPHGKVYSCIMFCFLKGMMVCIERMVHTCFLNMNSNLCTYIPDLKKKKVYIA